MSEAHIGKGVVRGFTLVETLVAITILTLAVTGATFTASRTIIAEATARDQLIASHLAQEGIEYMRWMRDNEYLAAYHLGGANVSDTAWTNFLNGLAGDSYAGLAEAPSPFTRTVQGIVVSASEERIVSTVTWNFRGTQYSVVVTDHFTPWQ